MTGAEVRKKFLDYFARIARILQVACKVVDLG